jgi:hypothetical protein
MTVIAHRRPHTPPMASPFLEDSVVLLTIAWPGGRHESINDSDGPSQT